MSRKCIYHSALAHAPLYNHRRQSPISFSSLYSFHHKGVAELFTLVGDLRGDILLIHQWSLLLIPPINTRRF
jgi:hypothetical protein